MTENLNISRRRQVTIAHQLYPRYQRYDEELHPAAGRHVFGQQLEATHKNSLAPRVHQL